MLSLARHGLHEHCGSGLFYLLRLQYSLLLSPHSNSAFSSNVCGVCRVQYGRASTTHRVRMYLFSLPVWRPYLQLIENGDMSDISLPPLPAFGTSENGSVDGSAAEDARDSKVRRRNSNVYLPLVSRTVLCLIKMPALLVHVAPPSVGMYTPHFITLAAGETLSYVQLRLWILLHRTDSIQSATVTSHKLWVFVEAL